MKIGYPCINTSLPTSSKTFRLASFTEERFLATVSQNLTALKSILEFNVKHNLLFFRISSGLIPFASHLVNTILWQKIFEKKFNELGEIIRDHHMRISMHPDQFVLLNSPTETILERSVAELTYHNEVLDLLKLDSSHKIQIHVGGVYADKPLSIKRFIERYLSLPEVLKKRLVIENDDRLYSLSDCMQIHASTGVPILFDNLHHECLRGGESLEDAFAQFSTTWKERDGIPMVDYSEQSAGERIGKHSTSLTPTLFQAYLQKTKSYDFDIMLEIKDKEKSARTAEAIMQNVDLPQTV